MLPKNDLNRRLAMYMGNLQTSTLAKVHVSPTYIPLGSPQPNEIWLSEIQPTNHELSMSLGMTPREAFAQVFPKSSKRV